MTPFDLSLSPVVIGSNFLLALILALLFGTTQAALDGTVEAREQLFRQRLGAIARPLGIARTFELVSRVPGWLLLAIIPGVLLVYGVLFSILDADHGVPSKELLFLVVSLGVSLGIIELGDDLGRFWWARRLGAGTSFALNPVNMVGAFVLAAVSRLLAVVPGFVIGVPGGLKVDEDGVGADDEVMLSVAGWLGVLFLALAAWGLAAGLTLGTGDETAILGVKAPYLHDFLLIIWLAGIEVMFFDLVPWFDTGGQGLYRYSRSVWAAAFGGIGFAAWHTLLNPNGDLIEVFRDSQAGVVLAIVAVFAVGLLFFWWWKGDYRGAGGEPDPG